MGLGRMIGFQPVIYRIDRLKAYPTSIDPAILADSCPVQSLGNTSADSRRRLLVKLANGSDDIAMDFVDGAICLNNRRIVGSPGQLNQKRHSNGFQIVDSA